MRKNFIIIPLVFILALIISFIFSEKDPAKKREEGIPVGGGVEEKMVLTEKDKNSIWIDIQKATGKLLNLSVNFSRDASKLPTREELDRILPNYYDDPILTELRENWYDKIITGSRTILDSLPLIPKEQPKYTVITNEKVKVVWDKAESPSDPKQIAKLEITVVKKDGKWKISTQEITPVQ
ncbi:hypothetical protein ACQKP0_09860 [Heyndrickxia sp. NPDC080065]|uniref:hypothetical protein n=1 Tax=Heyndrickxia sp. NPDC080065 TaxID=3390568 RepID=UPI003D03C0D0